MRRAVIVDDEAKSIEVLKMLVESFIEGLEIVGTANDIETAVQVIESTKPDIAFLDITLKEGDSFQILKRLKKIDFDVVFITAYDEFTVRALSYSGIHCLYKPIDLNEFERILTQLGQPREQTEEAIEIASQLLKSKFTKIPVISDKGLLYISPEQIDYIEADETGSTINFSDFTNLLTNKPISDLAAVMENSAFGLINNHLLINLKNILVEKTKPGKLIFQSGAELRMESEEVKKALRMLNPNGG
jgi:two-component system LytT family response regulator